MWIRISENTLVSIKGCNMIEIVHTDNLYPDGSSAWSVVADVNTVSPVDGRFMTVPIGDYTSKEEALHVLDEIEQGINENVKVIKLKETPIKSN